jgi:acyl dehydratase
MKFDELRVGQVVEAGPYRVTEDEVCAFAAVYDPQWFHADPEAAARVFFEGLIASGWHTSAIAMRLATEAVLKGAESFASPGVAYIKWRHPVRPGDELSLKATFLDIRRSRSQPSLGILRWRWQLSNATGAEVPDLEVTSLFDLELPDSITSPPPETHARVAP